MRLQPRHEGPAGTAAIAEQCLRAAAECPHLDSLWQQIVSVLGTSQQGLEAQLVHGTGGRWEPLTSGDIEFAQLAELLGTVADTEQSARKWPYAAVPLAVRELPGLLVCLHFREHLGDLPRDEANEQRVIGRWELAVPFLSAAIATVWQRQQTVERLRWLEEVLRSVDKWNQARLPEERVHLMERSAVQLLSCQHAFLLFVSGTEQRPIFSRRIVAAEPGQRAVISVRPWQLQVRKGQVYRGDQLAAVNDLASIGIQLDGNKPRSVLIAPLAGRRGEVVAALLFVNKRSGLFSSADCDKAVELGQYMATAMHQQPTDTPLGERPVTSADRPLLAPRLIGDSEVIRDLRHTVQRVAQTELPVLVMGENGTGKEVICRMIHLGSSRAERPFLAVNCAAISESLLESELFGHEKGAFTDANRTRAGKFELAHGGTLFLDEIGDMSLSGQVKLLRVLEEKVVTRVGGTELIDADVRLLAATNKDLAQLVRDRQFREDLFFRLNVVTLRLPPLRARYRDILMLAQHFLDEFSHRVERPAPILSAEAQRRLLHYQWPGNVRELRNLMERIVFLTTDETVDEHILAAILPDTPTQSSGSLELPLTEATRQFQIDYITHHIEVARGNMSEAARRLGLHRSNLYRKLSQLGLAEPESQD